MTNKEILESAIRKAHKNNWKINDELVDDTDFQGLDKIKISTSNWEGYYRYNDTSLIFSHDFAKAFWGDKDSYRNVIASGRKLTNTQATQKAWKFHLQQMGLEENPIKYLEKFL